MVDLERKLAESCNYALIILVLATGLVVLATNNNFVLAQTCTAQLGSPIISTQLYYGTSFEVTLPVSATCPFYPGQLYAVGTAYDTTYNSNVGTANSALSATYGGYSFSGQLQFNLPTSAESHSVQFSVSIYSQQAGYGQSNYGALLTTTSATFVVGPSYYQSGYPSYPYYPSYPTYPTYPSYPSYPTYPTYPSNLYCPSYPWYPTYPSYPGYSPGYPGNNYYHHQYAYCHPSSGYYNNYYHNGYYNNNNNYCSPSRNFCNHH
jgi:hypothetical protein